MGDMGQNQNTIKYIYINVFFFWKDKKNVTNIYG